MPTKLPIPNAHPFSSLNTPKVGCSYSNLVPEPIQQHPPPARRYRHRSALGSTCRQNMKAGIVFWLGTTVCKTENPRGHVSWQTTRIHVPSAKHSTMYQEKRRRQVRPKIDRWHSRPQVFPHTTHSYAPLLMFPVSGPVCRANKHTLVFILERILSACCLS